MDESMNDRIRRLAGRLPEEPPAEEPPAEGRPFPDLGQGVRVSMAPRPGPTMNDVIRGVTAARRDVIDASIAAEQQWRESLGR